MGVPVSTPYAAFCFFSSSASCCNTDQMTDTADPTYADNSRTINAPDPTQAVDVVSQWVSSDPLFGAGTHSMGEGGMMPWTAA